MQTTRRNIFTTIRTEGAILPADLLQRIAEGDGQIDGVTPQAYHLVGNEKLNEAINRSWNRMLGAWTAFQTGLAKISEDDPATTATRERWLLPLFQELGYGRLVMAKASEIEGKSYPISHVWDKTPIHLVGCRIDLDRRTAGVAGAAHTSPHSLVQEFLNRSDNHLWAFVSNGYKLRILRDNVSLTRQAYVEFDLQTMLEGEVYSDFVLLWLLGHQSRVEGERPDLCWLEKWSQAAQAQGTRALEHLREGVAEAITALGRGFLSFPENTTLCQKLQTGALTTREYYRQLLRQVYRLIFLFVAEDRGLLLDPQATPEAKNRYIRYYSTTRLRRVAEHRKGSDHVDLWRGLRLVFKKLGDDQGCPALGLPPLGSFLWSLKPGVQEVRSCEHAKTDFLHSSCATPDLDDLDISNRDLLETIRALAFTIDRNVRRAVDYKNLGSEELGSVYESLLEYHPIVNTSAGTFALEVAAGNERKTTGSHYTPTQLITCLLDSALDPVIEETIKGVSEVRSEKPRVQKVCFCVGQERTSCTPEEALLNLKICDPACGSGHFLIAAAHRLAKRLAALRTGDDEPAPEATRSALRDVVGRCLYGVDLNPMAVELCKFSLWLEALEPGKPLSFLDHHIKCGNSLLGATPALLKAGIPDAAFTPIEGDDKKICQTFKKENKSQRTGQFSLFTYDNQPWNKLGNLAQTMVNLQVLEDSTIWQVREKQAQYEAVVRSTGYLFGKLWAAAWCAAFVWKKDKDHSPPLTEEVFRKIEQTPYGVSKSVQEEIQRLAQEYQFFHWHLEFPDVFRVLPEDQECKKSVLAQPEDEKECKKSVLAQPEDEEEYKKSVLAQRKNGLFALRNEAMGWQGGFDVVLGNPPWERIKLQEKEWFAPRQPDIANAPNAAKRRKLIQALATEDPLLYTAFLDARREAEGQSHFVRDSGRYPLCGRGDVNTYAVFAELNRQILSNRGRVGCIVPSGIATDDTTKFFFQDIMESRSLVSLYDFENRQGIFPAVHRSFKFCLLTVTGRQRSAKKGADFIYFVHNFEELHEKQRFFSLSAEDVTLINPNTKTCPVFRSGRDAKLTRNIYHRVPALQNDEILVNNYWGVYYLRLIDMSDYANEIRSEEQLLANNCTKTQNKFIKDDIFYLPLYEGKLIFHFDHRFATFAGVSQKEAYQGKARETQPEEHINPCIFTYPRYWVSMDFFESVIQKYDYRFDWLLAFRDVTNTTNERTVVPIVFPRNPATRKLPTIGIKPWKFASELLSNLSSFVLDYIARQKVGGTSLSFYIFKQLPIIEPNIYEESSFWDNTISLHDWIVPRVLELTYTAWDLEAFAKDCGYDGPPFRWDEERRFLLRCELDAAYFHLYGIERDDVDYIMETFPIVKRKDEAKYGEYRTKRVILEIYDEMQECKKSVLALSAKTDFLHSYQTRLDPPPADPRVAYPPREEEKHEKSQIPEQEEIKPNLSKTFSHLASKGSLGEFARAARELQRFYEQNRHLLNQMSQAAAIYNSVDIEGFDKILKELSYIDAFRAKFPHIDNAIKRSVLETVDSANRIIGHLFEKPNAIVELLNQTKLISDPWQKLFTPPDSSFKITQIAEAALQGHIARISELSVLTQASIYDLNWEHIGNTLQIQHDLRNILQNNFLSFTTSYSNLYRSFEENLQNVILFPPFVSELPAAELFNEVELLESFTEQEYKDSELIEQKQEIRKEIEENTDERLPILLENLDRNLLTLLDGAKFSLKSTHPDSVRHCATSLRELFTHVLHTLAPDVEVRKWNNDPTHYDEKGRPTRKARLLYICRTINHGPFTEFIKQDIKATLEFLNLFQRGTHKVVVGYTPEQLKVMLIRMESTLRLLLEIGQFRT